MANHETQCMCYMVIILFVYIPYIDSSPVSEQPSLRDIVMECSTSSDKWSLQQHWEEIGIQVEVKDQQLWSIKRERKIYNCSEDQFRQMIRYWLQQSDPQPTWSKFVEALERLKICPTLSDHLKSKYCKYIIL